jgi:hypothetical protein
MINKTLVETALEQLPNFFTIGRLVDEINEQQKAKDWIVYYNPIVMKDDTMNCLCGVLMNKNNPILCVEDHIQAIQNKLYKDIMTELNYDESKGFDKDELQCLVEWVDGTFSNFHSWNVTSPKELYEEIINCDNFFRLTSDLRDLWKGVDLGTARSFLASNFRVKNEVHISEVESAMSQGVAIFNEHLASIFAEDDSEE